MLAKYAANVAAVVFGAVVIPNLSSWRSPARHKRAESKDGPRSQRWPGFASLHAVIVVGLVNWAERVLPLHAPIAGIAIGMGFVPLFFNDIVPQQLTNLFPVEIGNIASQAVRGAHLAPWQPVLCGVALLVVCLVFTCYRVERRQLQ